MATTGEGEASGSGGSDGANGGDMASVVAAPKKKGKNKHGKRARLGRKAHANEMRRSREAGVASASGVR